jgi:hypothetical protein
MKKKELTEFIDHNLEIIGGDKPEVDVSNAITRQKSTTDKVAQSSRQTNAQNYYTFMGFTPFFEEENQPEVVKKKDIITESTLIEDYITSICIIDGVDDVTGFTSQELDGLSDKIVDVFGKCNEKDRFSLVLKLIKELNISELPATMKFSLINGLKSNNPTITEK